MPACMSSPKAHAWTDGRRTLSQQAGDEVTPEEARKVFRLRIDASRCDGQGVCKTVAPELFELDRYGDAYVVHSQRDIDPLDRKVLEMAREAESMCPRAAIFMEQLTLGVVSGPLHEVAGGDREVLAGDTSERPGLLLEERAEDLGWWRGLGGFTERQPGALTAEIEQVTLRGQGGAGFPVARKWRNLRGADPVVVVNGAEREPGTVKDGYLLTQRPLLVLDGALAAAREVGSTRVIVAVPEGEPVLVSAVRAASQAVAEAGLAGPVSVEVSEVPRAYVAGEETALLAVLQGEQPRPRLRPPYPAQRGLYGRPTLVQNTETLAIVALVNAYTASWFGLSDSGPEVGTGLFSVGAFGGDPHLYERPIGYRLDCLIAEAGFTDPVAGVLVGGFSGGLVPPEKLAVALDSESLAAVGARLGTKSVQVLPAASCPLRVVVEVLGFFSKETASQCPPCYRGLPDMRAIIADLDAGHGTQATLADLQRFMETLPGRGICALPDGAATITLSYLRNFANNVATHLAGGCPNPVHDVSEHAKVNA